MAVYNIPASENVLPNPSVEESPVSVMEALAYETPVISYEDCGRLVDRHGIAIGQRFGTGLDGLPDLTDALRLLSTDDELRRSYGVSGQEYVEKELNNEAFLTVFRDISIKSGVTKASKSIMV